MELMTGFEPVTSSLPKYNYDNKIKDDVGIITDVLHSKAKQIVLEG